MKPPVSVCHHVSEMGHRASPTTLKNHLQWLLSMRLISNCHSTDKKIGRQFRV
jgi:hypothetical protein